MRMSNKAHSQLAISRAKTITVRTGSMQRRLFPTAKGDKKQESNKLFLHKNDLSGSSEKKTSLGVCSS